MKLGFYHLSFADDLLLFYNGRTGSIKSLMAAFKQFSICFGSEVNLDRSQIFMIGVQQAEG